MPCTRNMINVLININYINLYKSNTIFILRCTLVNFVCKLYKLILNKLNTVFKMYRGRWFVGKPDWGMGMGR